jgi:hypothetical protein
VTNTIKLKENIYIFAKTIWMNLKEYENSFFYKNLDISFARNAAYAPLLSLSRINGIMS